MTRLRNRVIDCAEDIAPVAVARCLRPQVRLGEHDRERRGAVRRHGARGHSPHSALCVVGRASWRPGGDCTRAACGMAHPASSVCEVNSYRDYSYYTTLN